MSKFFLVCAVAGVLASLSGCGTAANHVMVPGGGGGPISAKGIYGGVRIDLEGIRHCTSVLSSDDDNIHTKKSTILAVTCLAILDLPLSAVGDTIMLPLTINDGFR